MNASRFLALALCLFGLGACASSVKPWEKGTLAEPHMQFGGGDSIKKVHEHVFSSKEGSFGGGGIGGGGCGCN